jgi:hypothetical protein
MLLAENKRQGEREQSRPAYNFLSYWANKHSKAVSQYIFT